MTAPRPWTSVATPPAEDATSARGELTDERALEALRLMMLSREVDRYAVALQRQGRFGTFGEARGQEATLVGAAFTLDRRVDWIAPQYRELPALVAHGMPLERLLLMYTYNPAGFAVPGDVNALCNQVSLAAQLPHAVGLAWGLSIQGRPGIVLAFVGDGGSSEGDFHEACNLAGLRRAPVVLVVQNNGWAISTPTHRQTAGRIAARAPGYGIKGTTVDGNDVYAVYGAVSEAVDRARRGLGATLVECVTYRLGAHNTNDDPSRYRDEAEVAAWEDRDPIRRLSQHLTERGLWSPAAASSERARIEQVIEDALRWVDAQPPPGLDEVFAHVYGTPSRRLAKQRAALERDGAG